MNGGIIYLHGLKYQNDSVPILQDHYSNNDFLKVRVRVRVRVIRRGKWGS